MALRLAPWDRRWARSKGTDFAVRAGSGRVSRAAGARGQSRTMLLQVHVQMMHLALDRVVSPRALGHMIRANLQVDFPWNQLGRDELHFDNNAFGKADAHLAEQRRRIWPALEAGRSHDAWSAFGRLAHTVQDFYSHTNYVDLWMAAQSQANLPPAPQIDPLDERLLNNAALCSGRPYLPWGFLSFAPLIGGWVETLLPADSHAQMHLDSPARGPRFEYAFQAAVKRTRAEYDFLARTLPVELLTRFRDLALP
jgi:hypothetical protein